MSWLDEHRDQALTLLQAAMLAPSSHNTQPWLFRFGDDCVFLEADRRRALPVNDPEDRELTLSCGCALFNLRVAAEQLGLAATTLLLPSAQEPDLLARLDLQATDRSREPRGGLLAQISRRRTYRQRFTSDAVPQAALAELGRAAGLEAARFVPLLAEEARQAAARLVAEGDAVQWANPSWRRELAAWMHPRRRGDGLVVPGLAWPVAQWVVRSFDMGGGVGARDHELAEHSPVLAVLATAEDDPRSWLEAGQALERVLLSGCELGLQASFLNQPVQVPSLRPRLAALAGGGYPQVLLRLGHPAAELPPAPRRPAEHLVDWDDGRTF